jgi:Uma2 family endonuclease
VTPAPRSVHQLVVTELFERLSVYLSALGRPARLLAGPADITYNDDIWVQPDLLVVPPHEVTTDWRTYKTLLLVVEILSPSSARGDRGPKRRAYLEHGAHTYWIVDADRQVVEVWHPGGEAAAEVRDTLCWRAAPDTAELRIPLAEIWAALPS